MSPLGQKRKSQLSGRMSGCLLVAAHQPTVAYDVSREDCRQPPFDTRFGHMSRPVALHASAHREGDHLWLAEDFRGQNDPRAPCSTSVRNRDASGRARNIQEQPD
jgi:hypothetical protein